jgi:ketosteroid isomerase-like protein
MKYLLTLIGAFLFVSCNKVTSKEDIVAVEKQFEKKCKDSGIAAGFYEFADENAVIKMENDSLLKGKEAIKNHFSQPRFQKATVTWNADFVEISTDGTLASTYGKYVWIATDSLGNKKDYKGVFHTVWKKQNDGSWKYIWD